MFCFVSGEAFSQQPDELQSLLASAQQAQARSDFQSAAEFYQKASNIHPEIAELKANLGLMYFQMGKNEEAAESFHQAIRLKPTLLVPNLFLGLTDLRLKHFEDAIPYLKRAALSKPTEVQTQLGLGEAYAGIGQTRLATVSYLRATQLDPENANAWYHLGVAYLGQIEADSRLLLARHKDSGYLQALAAENFFEQRALPKADEAYKKALTFPVVPSGTHARYGFLLLDRHELASAEHEFKAELSSDPGSLLAKLGMARLSVEQGATAQAAEALEEVFNTDAGFLRSKITWFKSGLSQQRKSELQEVLAERKTYGEATGDLAGILADTTQETRADDVQEPAASGSTVPSNRSSARKPAALYAAGEYRQCSDALAPRIPSLQAEELRLLASCAYLTGEYQNSFDAAMKLARAPATEAEGLYWGIRSAQRLATETLAHASHMDSSSPDLHVLLGDIYRQQKLFPDAEKEYRTALELQPDEAGARFGLALALLGDDRIDEAFYVTQAALKNNSDDPELNAVMGEILCARHDFSAAEPYLKKSLTTKPEYVSHVHALLGNVYAHTNRTQEAIAEFKLALADDKDGTVHYQIGRLYLKIGDHDAAQQAFKVSERMRREGLNRDVVAMQDQEQNQEEDSKHQ